MVETSSSSEFSLTSSKVTIFYKKIFFIFKIVFSHEQVRLKWFFSRCLSIIRKILVADWPRHIDWSKTWSLEGLQIQTEREKTEKEKMAWLTFLLVSILWGLVGGLAPFLVPSGPQKVRNIISNLLYFLWYIFYKQFDSHFTKSFIFKHFKIR